MRHGRARRYTGILALVLAGHTWMLWTTRHGWLGHLPLSSQALVIASQWPGVILGAIGVGLVVGPRISGLDDYQRTAVWSEHSLVKASWQRAAIASLVASLVATLFAMGASLFVGGFGQVSPGLVLVALAWPQVGLMAGIAAGLSVPRSLRMAALVVTPLALFYTLLGASFVAQGPLTELSPINTAVLPEAVETAFTSWIRAAFWLSILVTLICVAWLPRLRFWSALVAAAVMSVSILTLPQSMRPIPGANALECQASTTRVCWYQWGDPGARTFTGAVDELVDATPPSLRPKAVLGGLSADPSLPDALAIGFPGGDALAAPWPDDTLIRRSYVQNLVLSSCSDGPAIPFLTVRGYRAFGLDPDARPRSWDRTEADLRGSATTSEADFLDALTVATDDDFFDLLTRARATPAMCRWSLPQWTEATT